MKYLLVTLCLFGSLAQADMIRSVNLDITCKSAQSSDVFNLKTVVNGSELYKNGVLVATDDGLTAGTEGGPAYLQFVQGGYNMTVSGQDFDRAFDQSSPVTGYANASIWSQATGETVNYECFGFMVFSDLRN